MTRLEVYRGGQIPLNGDRPLRADEIKPALALHSRWPSDKLMDRFRARIDQLAKSAWPELLAQVKLLTETTARSDEERKAFQRRVTLELLQSPQFFDAYPTGWENVGDELVKAKRAAVLTFGSKKGLGTQQC